MRCFVECAVKTGFPGFWIFLAGWQPRLAVAKRAPEEKCNLPDYPGTAA